MLSPLLVTKPSQYKIVIDKNGRKSPLFSLPKQCNMYKIKLQQGEIARFSVHREPFGRFHRFDQAAISEESAFEGGKEMSEFKGKGKSLVQGVGRSLSGMVMPNIGAFMAWGLITTLFIATGWLPNEQLSTMVDPMLKYLLPLLVAYTAGKNVAGSRGAVIAAIAAVGIIVGSSIPMFLGVMIMSPFAAWVIKKFDALVDGKIPTGFEMLVNNFSVGILGMLLAILGFFLVGPFVTLITTVLINGANIIYKTGFLPLLSIFVEPAKVLFLNNAINHGIMGPIGVAQLAEMKKSVMFLVETNPGPGMGVILAYWVFAKGSIRDSAPGAAIIHFLGGIHEIYFPYVLMNPALLLAVIAGGASAIFTFTITGVGLLATPSPGSIFALLAMTPRGNFFGVILGVLVATAVSFLVAAPFVKHSAGRGEGDLSAAKEKTKAMKSESKGIKAALSKFSGVIVFACDAGMGSSAMGATTLQKKLAGAGIDAKVLHSAIEDIPENATYIVTQHTFLERVQKKAPGVRVYTINNFMSPTEYDGLIEELKGLQRV